MDYSELPAPITFNTHTTPRRLTGLAAVASTVSEMVTLPSAPVKKNGLVPLVGNVNDNARIDALFSEIEKVNVKLDVVIVDLVKYNDIIMQGVAEVDSSVLVAPVTPVALDVTHTLMMRQYDEMRRAIASEQSKMRVHITSLAISMALLDFVMSIVVMCFVYVVVYRFKEPAVCESFPSVLPTMYDNMICCARMFTEDSS
jgi:hypothetical protein